VWQGQSEFHGKMTFTALTTSPNCVMMTDPRLLLAPLNILDQNG
jgi:hypothetical protein